MLQGSTALLLPSIYECGGAVVLEAMACGIPAIATAWGGPADYLRTQAKESLSLRRIPKRLSRVSRRCHEQVGCRLRICDPG